MIKLVEELAGDYRAFRTKPGQKSFENPSKRLLFPEKHLKQIKLLIGNISYICEHCIVAVCLEQCW